MARKRDVFARANAQLAKTARAIDREGFAAKPAPRRRSRTVTDSLTDLQRRRMEHAKEKLEQWTQAARHAARLQKKWQAKVRYYERQSKI